MSNYTISAHVYFVITDENGEIVDAPIYDYDGSNSDKLISYEIETDDDNLFNVSNEIMNRVAGGMYGGGFAAGEHMIDTEFGDEIPELKSVE